MSEQGLKLRYLVPLLITFWVTGMVIICAVVYVVCQLALWLVPG